MDKKYSLKLASAVVVDGEIRKADSIVAVDERTAKDLLRRGKAVLATEADAPAVEDAPPTEADAPARPSGKKK